MKKYASKYGLMAVLLASASTVATGSVAAAEEKTRFESSGFMQSLDLFITEQVAKLRGTQSGNKDGSIKDLELSLRDGSAQKDGTFLYLRDRSAPTVTVGSLNAPGNLTDRPDFSSLLAPNGAVRGSYGQDMFGSNTRLGVSFGGDDARGERGFEIALESNYRMSMQGLSAATGYSSSDLAEHQYNLGLSVGYSGFNLDASLLRQQSLFEKDLSGYGVGFSYQAASWSARLSLNEYREGADLYGIENEARNIISVELGANYRLTDALGLSGGVRYYDYGSRIMLDPAAGEKSQMIFLGGRLKF